jgi:CRP/FNR family cyclic AMP-dependent transcriptional regulator
MPTEDADGFLQHLDELDRAVLLQAGRRRPMSSGEVLFREGDDADEVLVLLSGIVKVWVLSGSGRSVILDVLDVGSVVGELSAIDGGPRSAHASALCDGELFAIPSPVFRSLMEQHPSISLELLRVVAARLRGASRRQLEFSTGDALGHLCRSILDLADRYGSEHDGARDVVLPMGQEDLGAWGGLSREAVVKGLKVLRRVGWVEGEGRRLRLLDEAALRDRARA